MIFYVHFIFLINLIRGRPENELQLIRTTSPECIIGLVLDSER